MTVLLSKIDVVAHQPLLNLYGKISSGIKGLEVFQKASIHDLYWQNEVIVLWSWFVDGCLCIRTDFHAIAVNCKSAGIQTRFIRSNTLLFCYFSPKTDTAYRHSRKWDALLKNGQINSRNIVPCVGDQTTHFSFIQFHIRKLFVKTEYCGNQHRGFWLVKYKCK